MCFIESQHDDEKSLAQKLIADSEVVRDDDWTDRAPAVEAQCRKEDELAVYSHGFFSGGGLNDFAFRIQFCNARPQSRFG